jgi:hypothetical protein
MATCEEPFIKCFVERTKNNLEQYRGEFEITNLINSLLGLLVFPAQKYFPKDAKKKYKQQVEKLLNEYGVSLDTLPHNTKNHQIELYDYIRKLRNGIAHAHIEPISIHGSDIDQLKVWNLNDSGNEDFEVTFDFTPTNSMKKLIENFSNFLENITIYELFENVSCIDFKYKDDKRTIAVYDTKHESYSFEFINNNFKCLTKIKTKDDESCNYFLDQRILEKIVNIIGHEFDSSHYDAEGKCKINSRAIEKIFWGELEKKGLAFQTDGNYRIKLT